METTTQKPAPNNFAVKLLAHVIRLCINICRCPARELSVSCSSWKEDRCVFLEDANANKCMRSLLKHLPTETGQKSSNSAGLD